MDTHGVKTKDLAKDLGVIPGTISGWRKESPPLTPDRLDAIAESITRRSIKGGIVKGLDLLENKNDFIVQY